MSGDLVELANAGNAWLRELRGVSQAIDGPPDGGMHRAAPVVASNPQKLDPRARLHAGWLWRQ